MATGQDRAAGGGYGETPMMDGVTTGTGRAVLQVVNRSLSRSDRFQAPNHDRIPTPVTP